MTFKCPVKECGLDVPRDDFHVHVAEKHPGMVRAIAVYLRHQLELRLAQNVENPPETQGKTSKSPESNQEHAISACT